MLRNKEKSGITYCLFVLAIVISLVRGVESQTLAPNCPELKVIVPDYVLPRISINVSAEIPQKGPVAPNWLIIKENSKSNKIDIERFNAAESVQFRTWEANEGGLIVAVASIAPTADCEKERIVAATFPVVINAGSPLIIDEFRDLPTNEQKGRLDNAIAEMNEHKDFEFLIYLRFKKTDTAVYRRSQIAQVFDHVVKVRKFEPNRVTFVLSVANERSIRLERANKVAVDVLDDFPEYMVIRAELLSEYKKLFQ